MRLAGRYFYYDVRKARELLGLQAPRSFRRAVADTLAWYRNAGEL